MFLKAISLRVVSIKLTPHGCQLKINKREFSRYAYGLTPNNLKLTPPWKVLFFGTDEYAVEHLKVLNDNYLSDNGKVVESLEVVTPSIDKCAVGEYARNNCLKHFKWPLPKTLDEYDVGVVVSFGHLIPNRIIDAFPYGILNVHPSILPRWRGASPIVHTVLNGDRETGVSIMEIRPTHFDIGPLLMQEKYSVPDGCTTYQLRDYLASQGSAMLLHALRELPKLEKLEYEQRSEGVTYAHRMSIKNAAVNWEKHTAVEIDRQYRALSEIFGLRSMWNGHKVRLMEKLSVAEMNGIKEQLSRELQLRDANHHQSGFPHYLNSHQVLCIKCLDGWTGFKKLVLKKPLTAKMFYNGYLSKPEFSSVPFKSQENELHKFQFKPRPILTPLKSRQTV